jgi:uncharacterized protein YndB with AHSA1/START domain
MAEPSLTLVRRFRAPPRAVFDACTDPARLRLWFGPGRFRVTRMEADARVGGRLAFRMEGPEGAAAVEGTFREVDPPRRVVLAWTWTETPDGSPPDAAASLVTFAIEPDGAGSRLTLTQERLADDAVQSHAAGWAEALEKLARLIDQEDAR